LTMELKEQALSRGVDLIGITSARPFVRRGQTETVIDPKELLKEARSIVVAGFYMNEVVPPPEIDRNNPRGRFTQAYSVRAHTPMESYYIEIVQDFLKERGYRAVSSKSYRIPDKMAAVRAGLGKYGKNSVIITEKYGSFVMFVSLVTDAPLEYEELDLNDSDCSSCDLCLKSCPTEAIYEPYRVNRKLCITDWLWGAFIPAGLREKQENRLFGCGECVRVCPRNENLAPREGYPVKIDDVSTAPELIPLVTGSKEYYQKTIASFPLCAGVDALRGNAIIALGNMGTDRAIDALGVALVHPKPQIRAYAAWSLSKIGGAQATRILQNSLQDEEDQEVRKEIQSCLRRGAREHKR
jgi:epoxyqueuosine reductase